MKQTHNSSLVVGNNANIITGNIFLDTVTPTISIDFKTNTASGTGGSFSAIFLAASFGGEMIDWKSTAQL